MRTFSNHPVGEGSAGVELDLKLEIRPGEIILRFLDKSKESTTQQLSLEQILPQGEIDEQSEGGSTHSISTGEDMGTQVSFSNNSVTIKASDKITVEEYSESGVIKCTRTLLASQIFNTPYTPKKANDLLYMNYSVVSFAGALFMATKIELDETDWIVLGAVTLAIIAMSAAAKYNPERFQSSVKTADALVIAASGVRDTVRITTTGALFYWAFSAYANGQTMAMDVGASDIILGLTADPIFWITTATIGMICAYLKYKVSQGGASVSTKQMEQGIRGAYMTCSASTMLIMTFDCMVQLWSNMANSGYGLMLADPMVAAIVFSVIALAAVAGIFWGVRSQKNAQLKNEPSVPTLFEKCDKGLLKVRMMFMPFAVVASILHPPLILAGVALALGYLMYTHYQSEEAEGKMKQKSAFWKRGFFDSSYERCPTNDDDQPPDELKDLLLDSGIAVPHA